VRNGFRSGFSGVQEFRSSGVQEFRSSGVQEFRNDDGEVLFVDYILREKLALSEIDGWSEVFWFISGGGQPLALLDNRGRCWKAWEYHRRAEEGLIGEIEDPFEAVKWHQVLGGEGFLRQLKVHWNQRVEDPRITDRKKPVSCRS
jgi:hypothetical protein